MTDAPVHFFCLKPTKVSVDIIHDELPANQSCEAAASTSANNCRRVTNHSASLPRVRPDGMAE